MSASLTEQQLRRWTFPPTGATLAPEESISELKLELLTISRMYRNVPAMSIDQFVVFGMSRKDFIAKVYNMTYNQISYPVDVLLDKLLNELE